MPPPAVASRRALAVALAVLAPHAAVSTPPAPTDGNASTYNVYVRGSLVAWKGSLMPCNLVFVKVYKTASSTTGGVIRQIAAHHAIRGVTWGWWNFTVEPAMWASHGEYGMAGVAGTRHGPTATLTMAALVSRLAKPTVLLATVRSPALRCLSAYYHFAASRNFTTEGKVAFSRQYCRNEMYWYLRPEPHEPHKRPHHFELAATPKELVDRIYSWVGVVERYDESMVLLADMLNLPLREVLYLSSKNSSAGIRDDHGATLTQHGPLAREPPEVRAYVSGREFAKRNALDFQLYDAANAELTSRWRAGTDMTERLTQYLHMLDRTRQACSEAGREATIALLDRHDGHGCYYRDNGCGYRCVDALYPPGTA